MLREAAQHDDSLDIHSPASDKQLTMAQPTPSLCGLGWGPCTTPGLRQSYHYSPEQFLPEKFESSASWDFMDPTT